MSARRLACAVVALLVAAGCRSATPGTEVTLTTGPRLAKRVTSLRELRARHVVFQEYDFSCGAATIATLLTYYFGEPATEREIIEGIAQRADMQKVLQRRAFSLLDMKRFAEARGYRAVGYRMDFEFLVGLGQPVILPVVIRGYDHFVIFKGVVGDRVFIADPAFGNYTMRVGRFMSIWRNGIGFVLERTRPTGPMTREDRERQARFMVGRPLGALATQVSRPVVPIPGQIQSVTGPRPPGGNTLEFLNIQPLGP